jgi:RNA polymerase sigma-70 factor (ECF subfamily)
MTPTELTAALDAVAGGNRDAFRRVVRAYALPLRSFLAAQLHHFDDVDDMAQEVFLAAYRGLDGFRRGGDFGAWLKGIAQHKLANHFRAAARRHGALTRFREEAARIVEHDLAAEMAGDTAEQIEALLRCVNRLPEKLRRVVRAGLDGLKPVALAGELATSVGAVYNLHYRANQMLRACVDREINQEPEA